MTVFPKSEPMLARLDAAIAAAQAVPAVRLCPYCGLVTDEACGSLPVSLGCTREYYSRY